MSPYLDGQERYVVQILFRGRRDDWLLWELVGMNRFANVHNSPLVSGAP